jgi:hypothetical protein
VAEAAEELLRAEGRGQKAERSTDRPVAFAHPLVPAVLGPQPSALYEGSEQ